MSVGAPGGAVPLRLTSRTPHESVYRISSASSRVSVPNRACPGDRGRSDTVLGFTYVVLAVIALAAATVAVLAESLIKAAVALGIGSAALALLLFLLDAPYAAGFELSVGAGLISVLFIIAISLAESMGRRPDES
jgi:uncharacterized MnhB-related membrane protein